MVDELYRKIVERALSELAGYRHEETGLVFVGPECFEGKQGRCAPIYENFLFALLLLRRKCVESTVAAKTLLDRLLHFQDKDPQSSQFGNFPLSVEEYPDCRDWLTSIRIGSVVYLINRFFGHLLGESLFEKLTVCHERLLVASDRTKSKISLSAYARALLAMQREDEDRTAALTHFLASPEALSPSHLGRIMAMAMACNCEHEVVSFANRQWHSLSGGYAGPACKVFQCGGAPEVTLFDIEMTLVHKKPLSSRPWVYTTCLDAAYTSPKEMEVEDVSTEVMVSPCFHVPKCPHGYHPVRVVMESGTLCVHTPGGQLVDFMATSEGFQGTVTRRSDAVDPTLLKAYIERGAHTSVTVDGERATVFRPTTGVTVECGKKSIAIILPLASTIGHIGFGNRSGQLYAKRPMETYDWSIEIEHISGSIPSTFTFSLRV